MSMSGEPLAFWTDDDGTVRQVPRILGRLKCGACSGHAALRAFVIRRDGGRCKACGESRPHELVADHIVSRRNGGSHHPSNLQTLCHSCNSRKAATVDRLGGGR